MAGKKNVVTKLAQVFNGQINPNDTKRFDWSNIKNALTKSDKTYSTSYFSKKKYIKKYKTTKIKDKKGKVIDTYKTPVYDYSYNHPYVATAHQYGFEIPKIHDVKSITFHVRMKVESGVTAKAPAGRFCIYGTAFDKRLNDTPKELTAYHNGLYTVYKSENLKTSWHTYTYTMKEDQIDRGGFKFDSYNAPKMGIDLIFDDAKISGSIKGTGTLKKKVLIAYVECVIEYYTPTYKVSFEDDLTFKSTPIHTTGIATQGSSSSNGGFIVANAGKLLESVTARKVYAGDTFELTAYFKRTINNKSKFDIKVDLPDGMEIIGTPKCKNTSFDKATMKWSVDCATQQPRSVTMKLKSHRSGVNKVVFSNKYTGSFTYKINIERGKYDGYETLILTRDNDNAHKNHRFCIGLDANGYTEDIEDYDLESDDLVAETTSMTYTISFDKAISGGYWSVPETGVGTEIISQSPSQVTVEIPSGNFQAQLNYCFYPKTTGVYLGTVTSALGDSQYISFEVFRPYVYHITSKTVSPSTDEVFYGMGTEIITISDHRTMTDIDIDTSSIPSVVDKRDANMVQSKCTMVMHNQDELDYIGCVLLEHLHFNPKSTFKDTLLNNTYKNKKYMGKKLAPDEDITLNVRLHPQQVTTIQGLIEMDKPIPINANHRCFEGDSLNHRGWAEIYSIKAEETNPHWYKCDIDVKYLTHNLNTRFKIDKGVKVSNYDKPQLMVETVQSGTKLDGSSEDTNAYFYVDTDGTYSYSTDVEQTFEYLDDWGNEVIANGDSTTLNYVDDNDDVHTITKLDNVVEYIQNDVGAVVIDPVQGESIKYKDVYATPDNQRNVFSIDEGQHIQVRTNQALSNQSVVSFEWLSTLQSEDKENNISRIIRLIDKKSGDTIFEYEYLDFVIDDDEISCESLVRVKQDGEWVTHNGSDIDMRTYTSLTSAEEDDDSGDEDDNEIELLYGSTLRLTLDDKKLSLVDEGFNSMEYILDDIDLISGDYYWETYWVNNNQDAESEDVVCYFDIVIASTILTSQYAGKYDKLYVSPFPVKEKNLLFTREAEEGTIYYLEDDKNEFSYVMNPYYQYHNGTDMVTNDGVSIFNLNYGYEIIYIQNGLVRLGFNRLNGNLYLGKYDTVARDYVTTHRLHLKKYDDINVNSITDDKIEIQASDSVFTIWRGHPYIMVKHNNESIYIDSQFNRVWAEQVGDGGIVEYPTNWMLENDKNLLPPCVGGKDTMNTSCFDFPWGYDEYDEPLPNPNEIEVANREDATVSFAGVLYKNKSNVTVKTDIQNTKFMTGTEYTFLIDGSTTTQKDHIKLADFYHGNFGTYNTDITVNHSLPYGISLFATKKVVQSNEHSIFQAKVFDYGYDGIGQKLVHFYEVYEPQLKLKIDKPILQSTETSHFDTYLVDSQDGNIIREEDREIHYYRAYSEPTVVYQNNGTRTSDLIVDSGVTVNVVDDYLSISTSSAGEKYVSYPYVVDATDNFLFECEIAKIGTIQSVALWVKQATTDNGCWVAYDNSSGKWNGGMSGGSFNNINTGALSVGDKVKIKQENGVITIYHNDTVVFSKQSGFTGTYYIGHYTNRDRFQYIKNISITLW